MPKHKGTEKLQAELKAKMKELKEDAYKHEKKARRKPSATKSRSKGPGR